MSDCIFCSIVAGEAPASRIYEDERVVAIMDIAPATRGHALVIPKEHYKDLRDIPREAAHQVLDGSLATVELLDKALSPAGFNIVHATDRAAWQTVFHFHVHVVPRYDAMELTLPWPFDTPRADRATLDELAELIRAV